jgi:hypothetical protein
MSDKIDNLPTNQYHIPSMTEVKIMNQLFDSEPTKEYNYNILKISSYLYLLYIFLFILCIKLSSYFNNHPYIIYHSFGILFFILSYLLLTYTI